MRAGRVMKLRESHNEKADAFPSAEGNTDTPANLDEGRSASPESKSSARAHTPSAREPGDLERASSSNMEDDRQPREGRSHKPRSTALEESDALVVSKKSTNSRVTPEESMEKRSAAKGKCCSTKRAPDTGPGKRATVPRAARSANAVPRKRGV